MFLKTILILGANLKISRLYGPSRDLQKEVIKSQK